MEFEDAKKFSFASKALPEDTFGVVRFNGTEGISKLYSFDITLVSDDPEIDLKEILQNPATLTILGDHSDLPVHGVLARFEQLHEVKHHFFYRAVLVPRLWLSNLYHENQLFLGRTVPDIIEDILKQAGLTTQDYELRLTKEYPQWEYICQYRETDYEFISRWMEREGIYFFFEQTDDFEKLVITDSFTAHQDILGDALIPYAPPTGLVPEQELIQAFISRQKMLPNKVILKDYNYRKPSLELKAEAEVDPKGRGDVYFYGEHFKEPEQGSALAKIRAEEIACRANVFHGESTATNLCSGYLFELADHYREGFNRKYLILDIEHEGVQAASFLSGLREELTEKEQTRTYTNRFMAIPAGVQFRPERTTQKPKIQGTMNAVVDAAGDGKYAELDEMGRYKVILPFDLSGNNDGRASRWVRMAQPYAGAEYGMHFPLHKGTEVLLTFIDGDPDRPIIASAVPNPATSSPVNTDNQSESVIKTGGDNKIRIEDREDSERIIMQSPKVNSFIRIGTPNDPIDIDNEGTANEHISIQTEGDGGDGIRIQTNGGIELYTGNPGSTLINAQDINIMTESKGGVNEGNINIEGYNIDTTCRGNFIDKVDVDSVSIVNGNTYEHVMGNTIETRVGNNLNVKLGTETEFNVLSSGLECNFLNAKTEVLLGGLLFNFGIGAKYENFIGPEYDAGWDDWNKHSNKSITIDAETKTDLLGGEANNSLISLSAGSLALRYGKHGKSKADNAWRKGLKWSAINLLLHFGAASLYSGSTCIPEFVEGDTITGTVDAASAGGTTSLTILIGAIAAILLLAFKEKKSAVPVPPPKDNARIELNNKGVSLSALAGNKVSTEAKILRKVIELIIPAGGTIKLDASKKGTIKIGNSTFKSTDVSIAGKNLKVMA